MRITLSVLLVTLALSTTNARAGQCFTCSRDRQQQCLAGQNSGTCTTCAAVFGMCTNGCGACLQQCVQPCSTPQPDLLATQTISPKLQTVSCVQGSSSAATPAAASSASQPWLFDKELPTQLAAYSASFARIVMAHQVLYTHRPGSNTLPLHRTGTFFTTDDPNEKAGTFEVFRNGQHWLYKIEKPLDDEMKLPNELDLTATTWTLFRRDDAQSHKVASGTIASDK